MPKSNAARLWAMRTGLVHIVLVAVLLAGCASVGPPKVERDRFDYVAAISESWKRQTLFNLVKLRYLDAPVFMDVASVINQYVLEGEIELGLDWDDRNAQSLGAIGTYTDRPTITYNPLMGEKFARSLMRPIDLASILALLQSRYPADYLLRICTQSIQGLENRRSGAIGEREADPEFYELADLFRKLEEMDAIGIRFQSIDNRNQLSVFFRPSEDETTTGNLRRIMQILHLDPAVKEFPVVSGHVPLNDKEIFILSRSLIQIMTEYASYIDVPESDISEGRVYAVKQGCAEKDHLPPLIRVRNGTSEPDKAYVAVPYRDSWFWIDDRDIHSKAMFYFLMLLFSFTERGVGDQVAPVITVPTN